MIEWRKKITVDGVPGIWTTNLSDDDLRAFHIEYGGQIPAEDNIKLGVLDRSFGFKYYDRMVQFRDGACRWALLNNENWLVYRTTLEWEIWVARKQEVDELQEEQEHERAAMALLLRTESDHLMREARTAVLAKDWATAERHLLVRADLVGEIERQNARNWWSYGIFESVSRWFSDFPSSNHGIEFLKKYDCRSTMFLSFAKHCAFRHRLPDEVREAEIEKVFDAAVELFPTNGELYKQACLFWRRFKRLDLAIKFCEIAIGRGVSDDTKSGFVGRLKRLQGEREMVEKCNASKERQEC
jgi:hypothetical protein